MGTLRGRVTLRRPSPTNCPSCSPRCFCHKPVNPTWLAAACGALHPVPRRREARRHRAASPATAGSPLCQGCGAGPGAAGCVVQAAGALQVIPLCGREPVAVTGPHATTAASRWCQHCCGTAGRPLPSTRRGYLRRCFTQLIACRPGALYLAASCLVGPACRGPCGCPAPLPPRPAPPAPIHGAHNPPPRLCLLCLIRQAERCCAQRQRRHTPSGAASQHPRLPANTSGPPTPSGSWSRVSLVNNSRSAAARCYFTRQLQAHSHIRIMAAPLVADRLAAAPSRQLFGGAYARARLPAGAW